MFWYFLFGLPSCPPVIITVARNANQFGRLPPLPHLNRIDCARLAGKTKKKLFVKKHRWILDDLLRKLCNGESHSECLIHVYLSNSNPVLPFNVLRCDPLLSIPHPQQQQQHAQQGQHRRAMRTCYTIHAKCLGTTSFFLSFFLFSFVHHQLAYP